MRYLIAILVLIGAVSSYTVTYEGYKVYAIVCDRMEQVPILQALESDNRYDFWVDVRKDGRPAEIMVAPEVQAEFEAILSEHGFRWVIKIENVQELIDEESEAQKRMKLLRTNNKISFNEYYSTEEIYDYLDDLQARYPNIVKVESYGKSTEGRELKSIRISKGGSNTRPVFFVDGGIHAREWISPAMVLYIIRQLVENKDFSYMTENMDWVIVPVINPDGYEYTRTNSRLWRKTRSKNVGSSCAGTDANRNWDHHWAEAGTSSSPCAETFHGASAFSEPETRLLAEYAKQFGSRIKFYLSFHSYGQYILYPFGVLPLPSDNDLLKKVGEIGHDAIRNVKGTRYTVGNTVEVMYQAAGGSHDWFKGVLGVQLSFTLELPGGGIFGFDLPPSKIDGVVQETFQTVIAWHKYVSDKY